MSDMVLARTYIGPEGAFSTLAEAGKPPFAVTVTRTYQQPDGSWLPVVPNGTFRCVRGRHQLESGDAFDTFEITGVAGHTGLLFHKGNLASQSKGCEETGLQFGMLDSVPGVLQSESAFMFFMRRQSNVDEFQLEVKGG